MICLENRNADKLNDLHQKKFGKIKEVAFVCTLSSYCIIINRTVNEVCHFINLCCLKPEVYTVTL